MNSKVPELPDFEKWKIANASFNLYDYIHAINTSQKLPIDFSVALSKLFWPEFLVKEGQIYLKENFDSEKFEELKNQRMKGGELEYWMNILSLDGFFADGKTEDADTTLAYQYLGLQVVDMWKSKLALEFPGRIFSVECILEGGEVFIVLKQI